MDKDAQPSPVPSFIADAVTERAPLTDAQRDHLRAAIVSCQQGLQAVERCSDQQIEPMHKQSIRERTALCIETVQAVLDGRPIPPEAAQLEADLLRAEQAQQERP